MNADIIEDQGTGDVSDLRSLARRAADGEERSASRKKWRHRARICGLAALGVTGVLFGLARMQGVALLGRMGLVGLPRQLKISKIGR